MANGLDPTLAALYKALNTQFQTNQTIPLNSTTLGSAGAGIVQLFQQALGVDAIVLANPGGSVNSDPVKDTVTVTGTSNVTLAGISTPGNVSAVFTTSNNSQTLEIAMQVPTGSGWQFATSFPLLGQTIFAQMPFDSSAAPYFVLLSANGNAGGQYPATMATGLNLAGSLSLDAPSPAAALTKLISSVANPLPLAGPVSIATGAESMNISGSAPDFSLSLPSFVPLAFSSVSAVMYGTATGTTNAAGDNNKILSVTTLSAQGAVATGLVLAVDVSLGQLPFAVGLAPGNTVTFATLSAIFNGLPFLSVVPDAIKNFTALGITAFGVQLTSDLSAYSNVAFVVESDQSATLGWDIIPAVVSLSAISIGVNIARDNQGNTTVTGNVNGTFVLGGIQIVVAILLPISNTPWTITAYPNIALPDLGDLTKLLGGNSLAGLMPPNFASIGGFTFTSIGITIDPSAMAVQNVNLDIASSSPWNIIPGQLEITSIAIAMQIVNPFSSPQVMGSVSGIITIEGVDVAINVNKDGPTSDWLIDIGVDPFTLPSVGAFAQMIGGSNLTDMLPDSLASLAISVTALGLSANLSQGKLETFTVGVAIDNWSPLAPYLVLDTLSANLNLDWTSGTLYTSGDIGANFDVVGIPLIASASYTPGNWAFLCGLDTQKGPVSLTQALQRFIPSVPSNLPNITIGELQVTFQTSDYSFTFIAATPASQPWVIVIDANLSFQVSASVTVSRKVVNGTSQFSGTIAGAIVGHFGSGDTTLGLAASYTFSPGTSTIVFKITFKAITLTCTLTQATGKDSILTVNLGNLTFGEIVEYLVSMTVQPDFKLSAPWDILNKISFDNLNLVLNLTQKTVGISYAVNVDLGILDLKTIGLTYVQDNGGTVAIALTGTFAGQEYTDANPLTWDMLNDPPPKPAGQGSSIFDLQYVGIGQHVQLIDSGATTMEAVLTDLKNAITQAGADSEPWRKLQFAPQTNWLFGAQFVVMDTVALGLVFNDPSLYGLRIGLTGGKAGILAGLEFEILYRKVTDTIGVYHIDLKLPDAMRQLQFGEVSITLPIIVIDIYTNGNFRVDFGFPVGLDFSNSFCVQVFPFVGYGGFYFALLNGDTSTKVPKITNGNFSPVIEFGLALSLGVGKTFDEGPLSAGVSVTIIGILEGVIGWFNPTDSSVSTDKYYWIQGTIAIVGKLYGVVDFVVIKASITVTAYASVTLTIEAHQPILIAMSVGVSVEAKVKFLFFSVSFHFSMTLSVSFTIGSATPTPWQIAQGGSGGGQQALAVRSQAARMLRASRTTALRASSLLMDAAPGGPNWSNDTPVMTNAPVAIEVNLIPAVTVAGGASPALEVVMAPFIANNTVNPQATDTSAFGQLVLGTFLWAVQAQVGQTTGNISAIDLDNLYNNLNDPTQVNAFTYQQLSGFLTANFIFTMGPLDPSAPAAGAAVLAITPPMIMTPAGGNAVDFGVAQPVTSDYQTGIAQYFQALSTNVDYNTAPDPLATQGPTPQPLPTAPLATVMFRDYFLIVAKSAVQAAQSLLKSYPYAVQPGDSLLGIANQFSTSYPYTIQHGDTLGSIATHTGVSPQAIQAANPGAGFTATGQQLTIPPATANADYITAAGDTIDTITAFFLGISAQGIVDANPSISFYNGGNPVAFAAGVLILVPLPAMLFSIAASIAADTVLNAATTVTLRSCNYPVQAGNTLASIATTFGGASAPTLAALNASTASLLAPGAAIWLASALPLAPFQSSYALPQNGTTIPGITTAAAWYYTRNLGTVNAPNAGWFVLAIQALNAGVDFTQTLAAGTTLAIPNAAMSVQGTLIQQSPNLSYTSKAGDTLASIAAMYADLLGPVDNPVLAWIQKMIQDLNTAIDFTNLAINTSVTIPLVTMSADQGPQQTGTDTYMTVAGDTLPLIAGYVMMTQLRAGDLGPVIASLNTLNPQAAPGTALKFPPIWHLIASGDTLGSIAAFFVMNLSDLATANASNAMLAPHALAVLPPLTHQLTANDTLDSIAGAYNLTLNDLVWRIAPVANTISAANPLDIPQAPEAPIQNLCTLLMGSQQEGNNISGIVSRFLMHGLQIPDPSDTKDFGSFTYPEIIQALENGVPFTPLYQVTGQQFALGAGDLNVTFTPENGAPQWLQFYSSYTAALNDTWASIAKQFNVNQTLLTQMNNGGSSAGPAQGTQVRIPAASLDVVATQAQLGTLPSTTMSLAITPQRLALSQTAPVMNTLSKSAAWQAAATLPFAGTPVTPAVGSPSIWFFPTALVDTLETQTATHPYVLQTGTQGNLTADASPVSAYDWATIIPINVKQVPGATAGSLLPNTYEMIGADQDGRDLLVAILSYLEANNDTAQVYLLYSSDPTSANPAGYVSDALDTGNTLLLQTNLSTETHSGPQGLMEDAFAAFPPFGDYYATLGAGQQFLTFLWECSAVGTGGYYLNYLTTSGNGLPGNLFVNNNQASLSVVVILNSQSSGASAGVLQSFNNCAAVQPKLDASRVNVFASVTDGSQTTVSSTVPPGNVGFYIQRPDPTIPTPTTSELVTESLFSLLQYEVPSAANQAFESDLIGLPAGPVLPPDGSTDWYFQDTLAVYTMAKTLPPQVSAALPPNTGNPYAGIGVGSQITLTFSFRDVFGNEIDTQSTPNLGIPVAYTDPLIGLGSWPGATGQYSFQSSGGTPQLTIYVNLDLSKYVPSSSNAFSAAAYTAASHYLKYSQVYYQAMQSDTAFYARTCFDQPTAGPAAIPAQSVQNFVQAACVYLNVAQSLVQVTANAANMGALASSYSVAPGSLFQANATADASLLFAAPLSVPIFYVTKTGDTLQYIGTQTNMDPGVILTNNQTLPLNAGVTVNGPSSQTYVTVAGDTAASVAAKWTIQVSELAALNLAVPNIFPAGTPLFLMSNPVTPESGQSLTDIVTAALITMDQLAAYNGSTALAGGAQVAIPGVVAIGPKTAQWTAYQPSGQSGLTFVNPLPTVGGNNYLGALAQQYNVNPTDLATVNGALQGFLNTTNNPPAWASGITPPQQPIVPNANDTLLSLVYRFSTAPDADPKNPVTLESLVAANSGLASSLNPASQVILPPQSLAWNNNLIQPYIPSPIFPVIVSFGVQRTDATLIDTEFAGVANMLFNETLLAPEVTADDGTALTLTTFATDFEAAFQPLSLKAATGPQTAATGSATNPIWAVSFGAGNFSNCVVQGGSPIYYAMQPLSVQLESRSNVPIQPYDPTTGTLGTASNQNFQGVDMDAWLTDLLSAVDLFLSPQFAVPGFLVNPDAVQQVIAAKKTIAQYISGLVAPILQQSVTPAQLAAAQEALYQSMLTTLNSAYTTNALVQFPVNVTSPYMSPYVAQAGASFPQLQTWYQVSIPYLAQQLDGIGAILNTGATVTYNSGNYKLQATDTIGSVAAHYGVSPQAFAAGVTVQAGEGLFETGVAIPLNPLQRAAGSASFASVAAWFGATVSEVAIANQNLPGIFNTSAQITANGKTYVVKQNDNLLAVTAGLGLSTPDQVATAPTVVNQTGLFNPTATLTCCDDTGRTAPRLSGKAIIPTGAPLPPQGSSFSTAKVPLTNGGSLVTFLFSTPMPQAIKDLSTTLDYAINEMEYNVDNVPGILGYQSSNWLSFIIPIANATNNIPVNGDIGPVDIPIPLRAYPTPPLLLGQSAGFDPDATDIADAKLWNFSFTTQQTNAAQDTPYIQMTFHTTNAPRAMFAVADPFPALAQFASVYSQMKGDLAQLLKPPQPANQQYLKAVVGSFATVINQLATAWSAGEGLALTGRLRGVNDGSYLYEAGYTYQPVSGISYYSTLTLTLQSGQPVIWPDVSALDPATNQYVELQPVSQSGAGGNNPPTRTYTFGSLQIEELAPITLAFDVQQLEVTLVQNASGGAYVTRNQDLIMNQTTNPVFVYQTPLVEFNSSVIPFIVNQNIITFQGDFQAAFTSFFNQLLPSPLTQDYTFKLTLYYSHTLLPSPGNGLDPIVVMVPVVFEPQVTLGPNNAIDAFVEQLWKQVQVWIKGQNPILAPGDTWNLEITMFSSLTGQTTMPVLELTRLANPM